MKKIMRLTLCALSSATLLSLATPLTASAHASAIKVYVYNCSTRTQRPREIVLACADANLYVANITWSGWSGATARAHGTLHWNTCTPNCAAGKMKSRAIVFTAIGRREVKGTWLYTGLHASRDTWRSGSAYFALPTSAL